jgi:hypothetical protein
MRRLRTLAAVATLALAGALPATASVEIDAAWRVAATGGDPFSPAVTVYFDPTGLAAAGDTLAVRTLWIFAEPQAPAGHRAMRADVRMRCSAAAAATVAASFHADPDARGTALARYEPTTIEWAAIAPRSLGALLLQSACAEAHRRGVSPS